jgi:hypothetical protein
MAGSEGGIRGRKTEDRKATDVSSRLLGIWVASLLRASLLTGLGTFQAAPRL